jgi:hypothetical protein
MAARTLNILLGIWLFISAFVWQHSSAQLTNTWILGILCVIFALIATRWEQVRYLNTILAVWLFISAFVLSAQSRGTMWNNALVAVAIFLVSLAPPDRLQLPTHTPRTV